jgi:CheY-like chemotaxis protein
MGGPEPGTAGAPPSPSPARSASYSHEPKTHRVLVVDDDADMLLLIGSALRHAQDFASEVFIANDPKTALQKAAEDHFDIVVADYQMPGQNGLQLLSEFREKYPKVMRVLITAHSTEELALDAIKSAQVHSYLEKPFHPRTLVAVLQEVVVRHDRSGVGWELRPDSVDVAMSLLKDVRSRLGDVPSEMAEVLLTFAFESPIELNGFATQATSEEGVKSVDVRYAGGRFLVYVTLRPDEAPRFSRSHSRSR